MLLLQTELQRAQGAYEQQIQRAKEEIVRLQDQLAVAQVLAVNVWVM